ncbi:MAG: hypothetical protein ABW178_03575 [Pseudoxanthomonas sp.]
MSLEPSLRSGRTWLVLLLTLLACGLLSLLWSVMALQTDRQCSWMALVVAVDAVICVRLVGLAPGTGRALIALLATAAGIALANWNIVALHMASIFGLGPLDAASKLGVHHAMTLLGLATGPLDYVVLLVALVGAFWAGR